MRNLPILAKSVTKEPKIGWILGLLRYAILYRESEVSFPKTAQP